MCWRGRHATNVDLLAFALALFVSVLALAIAFFPLTAAILALLVAVLALAVALFFLLGHFHLSVQLPGPFSDLPVKPQHSNPGSQA